MVFGHVLTGEELVREIEALPVSEQSRPTTEVVIANCGELVPQRKTKGTTCAPVCHWWYGVGIVTKDVQHIARKICPSKQFFGECGDCVVVVGNISVLAQIFALSPCYFRPLASRFQILKKMGNDERTSSVRDLQDILKFGVPKICDKPRALLLKK